MKGHLLILFFVFPYNLRLLGTNTEMMVTGHGLTKYPHSNSNCKNHGKFCYLQRSDSVNVYQREKPWMTVGYSAYFYQRRNVAPRKSKVCQIQTRHFPSQVGYVLKIFELYVIHRLWHKPLHHQNELCINSNGQERIAHGKWTTNWGN